MMPWDFSFPLGIFRGNSRPIGVKDKTFTFKEAAEKQGKVWIYVPTVILCKSLSWHSFQNKRVLALPKAVPWTFSLEGEIPLVVPLPLPSPEAQNALGCFSQESTECFPAVGMTNNGGQDPGSIEQMTNLLQLLQAPSSLCCWQGQASQIGPPPWCFSEGGGTSVEPNSSFLVAIKGRSQEWAISHLCSFQYNPWICEFVSCAQDPGVLLQVSMNRVLPAPQ